MTPIHETLYRVAVVNRDGTAHFWDPMYADLARAKADATALLAVPSVVETKVCKWVGPNAEEPVFRFKRDEPA